MWQLNTTDRQKEIFIAATAGSKPLIPVDFETLERQAKRTMPPKAFGYVAAGAGDEFGIRNNENAFCQYSIRPRMAVGVNEVDVGVTLFNTRYDTPMMFAPIGVLSLAHKKADLELATAAKKLNIPMVFSNQASVPMEACAQALGEAPHWFQLYFSKSNELVESLVSRAEKCGSKAIVLTLDTTQLGWRPRDLNNAYLPFLEGKGIAQYTSDPVFRSLSAQTDQGEAKNKINFHTLRQWHRVVRNYPGAYWKNIFSKKPVQSVRTFIKIYSRPTLNWADIQWLRSITNLPLLLKGILHAEDARKAADCGIDGLIISNHGGRQIDHVIASLDALVEIKKVMPVEYPLLFDSGVRSGADMFIALALGAEAVLIGRPYVYALSIAGSAGVVELCKNYMAELQILMSLCGVKNFQELQSLKDDLLIPHK